MWEGGREREREQLEQMYTIHIRITYQLHENSVGLSSTTNPKPEFHPEGIILGGGGEAPGSGCGFIYFAIQLSQIWGGGGGKLPPPPPPPPPPPG